MKIVSDNPEILEEIHNRLKLKDIEVEVEKKPSDKADMAGEFELVRLMFEIGGAYYTLRGIIKDISYHYNLEYSYVFKSDGTKIPFSEYLEMTDEELSEIFKV